MTPDYPPELLREKPMPVTQAKCPSCNVLLKLGKPIEEGKKIKCPKCATVFAVGAPQQAVAKSVAPARPAAKPAAPVAQHVPSAPPAAPPASLDESETRATNRKKTNPIVIWAVCLVFSSVLVLVPLIALQSAIESAVNSIKSMMGMSLEKLPKPPPGSPPDSPPGSPPDSPPGSPPDSPPGSPPPLPPKLENNGDKNPGA